MFCLGVYVCMFSFSFGVVVLWFLLCICIYMLFLFFVLFIIFVVFLCMFHCVCVCFLLGVAGSLDCLKMQGWDENGSPEPPSLPTHLKMVHRNLQMGF